MAATKPRGYTTARFALLFNKDSCKVVLLALVGQLSRNRLGSCREPNGLLRRCRLPLRAQGRQPV
eukprot:9745438-Lingulodinium_polyedra.AAC.1